MRSTLLALTSLLLLACGATGASASSPTRVSASGPPRQVGPITSAGDPSTPVPFAWSLHPGQAPDSNLLRLQGGTLHAIPDEARLLDAAGQVVASAPARTIEPADGPCHVNEGLVRAELLLPDAALAEFENGWPAAFRVEVRVGGTWRPTELRESGCRTIE